MLHSEQRQYQEVVYLENVELDEIGFVERALKWTEKIDEVSTISEKKGDKTDKTDKAIKSAVKEDTKKQAKPSLSSTDIKTLLNLNKKIEVAIKDPRQAKTLSDLKLQDYIARILVHSFELSAKDWSASEGGDHVSKKFSETINSEENRDLKLLYTQYYDFLLVLAKIDLHTSWYLIDFLQVFLQQIPADIGARNLVTALFTHTRSFVENIGGYVSLNVFFDSLAKKKGENSQQEGSLRKFTDHGTIELLSTLCTYEGVPISRNQKLILEEQERRSSENHFIPVSYDKEQPVVNLNDEKLSIIEFFQKYGKYEANQPPDNLSISLNDSGVTQIEMVQIASDPEKQKNEGKKPTIRDNTRETNPVLVELEKIGAAQLTSVHFSVKPDNLNVTEKNQITRSSQTSKLWAIARDKNGINSSETCVWWSYWIDALDHSDKNTWKICIGVTESPINPLEANGSSWNVSFSTQLSLLIKIILCILMLCMDKN